MTKTRKTGLTREQLWKVWTQLGSHAWLEIAQHFKRGHGFVPAGPDVLKGRCINPDHADSTPSMYIYPAKGYAKCFGSCGYYTSNPLQLLSRFQGGTEAEAAQYLQEKYGIHFLPKKALAELEAQRINLAMKQEIYDTAHAYMCHALADPNGENYQTARAGLEWLIQSRKLPKEVLHMLPVGIMPELSRLQQLMAERYKKKMKHWREAPEGKPEPLNHIESSFEYLKNYIRDANYAGSICFPLHVTPKEIGRLKFRVPNNDADKKFTIPEDNFENLLGLFGLGWDMYYNFTDPNADIDYAYLVEGEMDVLSLMARFAEQGSVKYPVFSAGGKGGATHIEPILTSCGYSKAFLIGDSPSEHGNEIVVEWLQRIHKMEVRIFSGWTNIPYKDIDEIVVREGEEVVTELIHRKFNENFSLPWVWALARAEVELDAVDGDDLRNLITKAAEHGKYLKNHLECEAYTQAVSEKYHLSANMLKREIASREDNENGFVMRCSDAIRDLLFTVGTETRVNAKHVVFFDKLNHRYCRVKLDCEQSIAQEFAPLVGTMCDFVADYIGYPTFLQNPATQGPEDLTRKKIDSQLRFYIKEAIQTLAKGLPDMTGAEKYRQGYHAITPEYGAQKIEYIVCGSDVFKMTRDEVANKPDVKYEKLPGPVDRNVLFDLMDDTNEGIALSWYPGGMSVDQLEAAKQTDLRALYDNLVRFYNTGFNFKYQKVTAQLLAAVAMIFPISDIFDRPLMLFITGNSSSGKSYLISTLAGPGNAQIRLLWDSITFPDYSIARISTYCNRSSRLLCLDEFEPESGEPGKAEKVREIFSTFRGLINGEAKRVRFRTGGQGGDSRMRMPVIFAAIQGAERTADLNRLLIIETQYIEYRIDPTTAILQVFSEDQIEELRRGINLGMFPHAIKLAELAKEMSNNSAQLQAMLPIPVIWRYLSSFFPILALMKYIGVDWKKFLIEYVTANTPLITRATTISESDQYLSRIMHTPALHQRDTGINYSVAQLLVNPDRRHEVNHSACGVHFDASTNLIVMLLDQVLPRLLPRDMQTGMNAQKLRTVLERNPTALTAAEIDESRILRKIGPTLGAGIRKEDVVVFRADRWLVALDEPAYSPAEEKPHENQVEETKESITAPDVEW